MKRSAIVVGVDRAVVPVSGVLLQVPPYVVSGLDQLLPWASSGSTERAVLLRPEVMTSLGLPLMAGRVRAEALDVPGWRRGAVGPWTTYVRGAATVHVAFGAWLDRARYPLHDPACGLRAGQLLDQWQAATGTVYRGTPGVAGTAMLRQMCQQRRPAPLWHSDPTGGRAREIDIARWTPSEQRSGTHRHVYDANRAYLAAAGCAEVAPGQLEHRGPSQQYDQRRAGWWLIEPEPWTLREMPPPHGTGSLVWVTTPTLRLLDTLREKGVWGGYRVRESWTAPGVRLFRTWADRLNNAFLDAEAAGHNELSKTIKAAYRETIGLFNREGGAIHRPDWQATIIAVSKTTVWRKTYLTGQVSGRWPDAVRTDAAIYTSDDPDPHRDNPGFDIGRRLGQFKAKATPVPTATA